MSQIINAMTVDVEDYFHVSAFENSIPKSDWEKTPLRVEHNTYRLLELFEKHNVKSTFFTLGWVAERCPNLIKAIVDQGHELASHGFAHQRITEMNKEEFITDVVKSKNILEQLSGTEIIGYRAPSFSINDSNTWVYNKLIELGFEYTLCDPLALSGALKSVLGLSFQKSCTFLDTLQLPCSSSNI